MPVLLLGAVKTLQITTISVFIGCILGLAAGLARLSQRRILRFLATCYVDFIRGTPLLVQVVIVYFGIPQVLREIQSYLVNAYGITPFFKNIPVFLAAVIACSLNSGAYVAEIFRAGIQSIDKGQMEAARSLGMTHGQAMRYVILPQAFKRVIPPLGNEFIALLKDTSVLSVIGFEELFRRGQLIVGATYQAFQIYLTVAFIYLVMVIAFSRLVDYLERRLKTGD
ncbi:amino acid ABC transporter permease [Desulfovirgula thermocuniculi]|uniref:amino acid ABC transporter permease n=1 Tax=Desulfovirgula thermocuniculi TaxID=348842 RepID=UPI001FE09D7F|nr:amino acid ABC transporter permease [Desulfovirgula thermocuniculi]